MLTGFDIRRPRPEELPSIQPWFAHSQIGWEQSLVRAAFGQPGDTPLGAVMVRPAANGTVGQFTICVLPEVRRRGIGRRLMQALYALAVANQAEHLVLTELIHEDEPENAFCRAMGLSPDMTLGTYELDIPTMVLPLCEPIVRRYADSHPHLSGTQIVPLEKVDPRQGAEFLTTFYTGFVEQQTERMRNGFFDRALSTASMRSDGSLTGVNLVVSRPGQPAILLDLVLTNPDFRNGPTPIILFAETARRSVAAGKPTVVFEADSSRDAFALRFARRCGEVKPRWYRYRYAIPRSEFSKRT